jgi:hypothetical protein
MYTLQGKSDQYATRIPRSIRVWSQNICLSRGQRMATIRVVPTRSKQAPTPERNLGDSKIDRPGRCLGSPHSPSLTRLGVGERGFGQVVTRLHRLAGPIYQHVIGTFNTCSWGPTHWSLTDTGEGYNHVTPHVIEG